MCWALFYALHTLGNMGIIILQLIYKELKSPQSGEEGTEHTPRMSKRCGAVWFHMNAEQRTSPHTHSKGWGEKPRTPSLSVARSCSDSPGQTELSFPWMEAIAQTSLLPAHGGSKQKEDISLIMSEHRKNRGHCPSHKTGKISFFPWLMSHFCFFTNYRINFDLAIYPSR